VPLAYNLAIYIKFPFVQPKDLLNPFGFAADGSIGFA